VAVIYKITNPSERARARHLKQPRRALHRAVTEQWKRYLTQSFRYAQLRGGSHRISQQAPDAAELVLDHIARAA
jgi:hypothetical protein